MPKTKVILHIGMHKTGTSAIQAFLFLNEESLHRNCDVLYLRSGRGIGGYAMDGHHEVAISSVSRYSSRFQEKLNPRIWKDIHGELESTKPKIGIMSSEFFWPADIFEIEAMRKKLIGYDVKIILYVRNQLRYALSAYEQDVKMGECSDTFEEYLKKNLWSLDYEAVLKRWCMVFGEDNVSLRIYDKEKHRLIQDFLQTIGIEYEVRDSENLKKNVTPPHSTILLLLQLNRIEQRYFGGNNCVVHKLRRHVVTGRRSGPLLSFLAKSLYKDDVLQDRHKQFLLSELSESRNRFLEKYIERKDWKYFSLP